MPKFLWMPYVVLTIIVVVLFFVVNSDVAWMVSTLGTVGILMGLAIHAGFHSKDKWPGLSFSQRVARVLTFYN